MSKWIKLFSFVLMAVFVAATVGVAPAMAAEKSPLQKQIERASKAKQDRQNQERIKQIDKDLEKNKKWRQEHGNDDRINQEKLNDRTRKLAAEKEGLQKQSGNQRPQSQPRGQSVQQENDREAGLSGTFGRQGQGQYRGQNERRWGDRR
jgi:cell division protein FtsN